MQSLEGKKCLASIALFSEICKKDYDIYRTLSEFIKDLVAVHNLHHFTALEIKRSLKDYYGFIIPENVIKNSIRKLFEFIELREHTYHVIKKIVISTKLADRQKEVDSINKKVVDEIVLYIESRQKRKLNSSEKVCVFESLYNFLLDGGFASDPFTKMISSYVIGNSKDAEFLSLLNTIKEGVLLFSGFQYSPEEYSKHTWEYPLSLYFDTEILFSLYGFNGDLYKSLVCELLELIQKINIHSNKRTGSNIIELHYFEEIENEINEFFRTACGILNYEDRPFQKTNAMKNIVNGCDTQVDVLKKKALFFEKLNSYGFQCDRNDYYKVECHQFNIESSEIVEEIIDEMATKYDRKNIEYGINILNKISILRQS